eukprot:gene20454-23389_t
MACRQRRIHRVQPCRQPCRDRWWSVFLACQCSLSPIRTRRVEGVGLQEVARTRLKLRKRAHANAAANAVRALVELPLYISIPAYSHAMLFAEVPTEDTFTPMYVAVLAVTALYVFERAARYDPMRAARRGWAVDSLHRFAVAAGGVCVVEFLPPDEVACRKLVVP